jgi:hypothetical protein
MDRTASGVIPARLARGAHPVTSVTEIIQSRSPRVKMTAAFPAVGVLIAVVLGWNVMSMTKRPDSRRKSDSIGSPAFIPAS